MHTPIVIRTLQDHIDHEHGFTVYCDDCPHRATLDMEAVAKRLGPDTPAGGKGSDFLRRFTCSKCGSKNLSLTVSYIHAGKSNMARGIDQG